MPPIPPAPASLAAECAPLPALPLPLIDPERLSWELQIIAAYADCAARHRRTVQAWPRN